MTPSRHVGHVPHLSHMGPLSHMRHLPQMGHLIQMDQLGNFPTCPKPDTWRKLRHLNEIVHLRIRSTTMIDLFILFIEAAREIAIALRGGDWGYGALATLLGDDNALTIMNAID